MNSNTVERTSDIFKPDFSVYTRLPTDTSIYVCGGTHDCNLVIASHLFVKQSRSLSVPSTIGTASIDGVSSYLPQNLIGLQQCMTDERKPVY